VADEEDRTGCEISGSHGRLNHSGRSLGLM
jgi:hypothetical protein